MKLAIVFGLLLKYGLGIHFTIDINHSN